VRDAAMKSFLRCPLVSLAGLLTYLVVNLGAAALHHHHGAAAPLAGASAAAQPDLQFQTTSPTDDDDEEHCLLCSVLHLVQYPPSPLHAEGVILLSGEAFSATTLVRPFSLETATRARSPPPG
jgi:hypothetical protein